MVLQQFGMNTECQSERPGMIHTGVLAGSLLEDLLIRGDLSLTVIFGSKTPLWDKGCRI